MKLVKIVVFVPIASAGKVRQAMGDEGAGVIGNYSDCSFSVEGIGRFKPLEGANPATGEIGKLAEIEMERVEMICPAEKAHQVIAAMKKVHPYEEVGEEIYQLLSEDEISK